MQKMVPKFMTTLTMLSSLALAAEPLPRLELKGVLPASQSQDHIIHAEPGDLIQLDIEAPSFWLDIIVNSPSGEKMADYTTAVYGDNSYSRRFVAKEGGNYSVKLKNWNASESFPFSFKETEHLSSKSYESKLNDLAHSLQQSATPVNEDIWTQFASNVKSKRIIALGEPSHGGKEFWVHRLNLALALAKNNKLRTIAIEMPYGDLIKLNNYISDPSASKRAAFADLQFSLWRTDGVKDFFEGLRKYNLQQQQADRIKIIGIDLHPSENDEGVVQALFGGKNNPESTDISYVFDSKWVNLTSSLARKKNSDVEIKKLDEAIKKSTELLDKINTKEKSPLYFQAWLSMQGRQHFLEDYRQGYPLVMSKRDRSLSERVIFIEKNTPNDQQILLLAHNMHVSKSTSGYINERLGWYLNKIYSSNYISIAGTFNSGDFSGIELNGNQMIRNFSTSEAQSETLEYYLNKLKTKDGYLLRLNNISAPAKDWLSQPIEMRSIPADSQRYITNKQFEIATPTKDFDYLLFLNTQTATD
jgi:erythromycin esterase